MNRNPVEVRNGIEPNMTILTLEFDFDLGVELSVSVVTHTLVPARVSQSEVADVEGALRVYQLVARLLVREDDVARTVLQHTQPCER